MELGLFEYPDDPIAKIKDAGIKTISFDATSIAKEIGDIKLGNTVMLGAIADYLPFSAEVLLQEILQRFANKGEAVLEKNKTAFEKGRQAVK